MAFTYDYPHMAVTVDVVLFDTSSQSYSILLIKRKNEPFKDCWALPGGYVDMEE
ncbi:NUDIX domain-containing protein [Pseudoalteromonas sp. APC 3495]